MNQDSQIKHNKKSGSNSQKFNSNIQTISLNTSSVFQSDDSIVSTQELIQNSIKTKILKSIERNFVLSVIIVSLLIFGLIVTLVILGVKVNEQKVITNQTTQDPINQNEQIYDLVILNTTSALCLDGTPAHYYISRTGNPENIYIDFQGGGWCANVDYESTMKRCYNRIKGSMGSSKYYSQTRTFNNGQYSNNEKNYFSNWKRVYFPYCDGTGHQGSRKNPIKYNNRLIYFRGHKITIERFESLEQQIGLFSKAKIIVLGGGSAGGVASTYWSDYVAKKAINAKVYNFAKSSIFLDRPNQHGKYLSRDRFKAMMNITNTQISHPLTECAKQYQNESYKCMFVQYMYQHIKVPMFIALSLYDWYSISCILGIKCDLDRETLMIGQCRDDQMTKINKYRADMKNLLTKITSNSKNGVWAIDCVGHIFALEDFIHSVKFQVPQQSGNQIISTVKDWIENPQTTHVFIDDVGWPNNAPCRGNTL